MKRGALNRWRLAVVLAAVATAALLAAGSTSASFPGANGQVTFERDSYSGAFTQQLFTVPPGGGSASQIAPVDGMLTQPAWSADGQRLAFVRNQGSSGPSGIYVTQASSLGSAAPLAGTGAGDQYPAWSPDGRHIVFAERNTNTNNNQVTVMNADGSGRQTLRAGDGTVISDGTYSDSQPVWSPDGTRIAFARFIPGSNGSQQTNHILIVTVSFDGQGNLTVTSGDTPTDISTASATTPYDDAPNFSPDSRRIAFGRSDGPAFHAYIADSGDGNTAGANAARASNAPASTSEDYPAFSPDGTQLAVAGGDNYTTQTSIYDINLATGNSTVLDQVPSGNEDIKPDWQPTSGSTTTPTQTPTTPTTTPNPGPGPQPTGGPTAGTPIVATTAPTGVTDHSAQFNGKISPNGQDISAFYFEFASGPGAEATRRRQFNGLLPADKPPSLLEASTTYRVRLHAIYRNGTDVAASNTVTFRTHPQVTTHRDPPTNDSRLVIVGDPPHVHGFSAASFAHDWKPFDRVQVSYQWYSCRRVGRAYTCDSPPVRSGALYVPTMSDVGHRLRVRATAMNLDTGTRAIRWSRLTASVPHPPSAPYLVHNRIPSITGAGDPVQIGTVLSAHHGAFRGTKPIAYRYRWQQCVPFSSTQSLCYWIFGAEGRTYKVSPLDTGTHLRVVVEATNIYGPSPLYASAITGVVAPPPVDVAALKAKIQQAFETAYGTEPSSGELDSWVARGDATVDQITEQLRAAIQGNGDLASAVESRAYQRVYGHGPNRLQMSSGIWGQDVADESATALTYDSLSDFLAGRLARQARQQIFFWDSGLQNRDTTVFVQRMREGVYVNSGNESAGEQLWTDVALSNDAIHGAARTSYPGDGARGAASREGCFGAVGPGCSGAPGTDAPRIYSSFTTYDGRQMDFLEVATAVGSIVHDTACRSYVGGAWCRQDFGNFLRSETPLLKYGTGAEAEWNKASGDVLTHRFWYTLYGPYPVPDIHALLSGAHGDAISYSDDLRAVAHQYRYTEVNPGGVLFGLIDVLPPQKWGLREMRATTRLLAPSGTALDSSDKDFCASGSFSSTRTDLTATIGALRQNSYGFCR